MKYFAKVGSNEVVIDSTKNPQCPDGYIEMQGDRPTPEHVAMNDGTWSLPIETAEEIANDRKAEIYKELDAIDLKSIRSLRAIASSTNETVNEQDVAKLAQLETEANALREELAELKKPKVEVELSYSVDYDGKPLSERIDEAVKEIVEDIYT